MPLYLLSPLSKTKYLSLHGKFQTARLDEVNTEINQTEAQRQQALKVGAAKEGPLSTPVGRPPSFCRPKLVDTCKPLAREFEAVDQTGENLAELKLQAKKLASEVSSHCSLGVFLRYNEKVVKGIGVEWQLMIP